MKLLKRALAGILTACTILTTCTACGENTATAMTIDGMDIPAGIYLYYIVNAYSDAMQVMEEDGADFNECKSTKDVKKIMKESVIDGVDADVWIQNKAVEYCQTYAAVEKDFAARNLTLTGEEIATIDSALANAMTYYGEFFEQTGISENSAKAVLSLSLKQEALWEVYYGEGGEKNIDEQEMLEYYADSRLRVKYIEMPLKDGEGNLLKSDGKSEIEKMAEDYLDRLAKKADDEAKLNEEFDFLIDEHNNYVTSLSNAAITTTDENGSTITTETTAKVTTTDEKDAAETTTTAPDSTDTTETTTVGGTTTTAGAETTTTPADGTTTETTAEATTTTTTTTVDGLGYDTFKEQILIVSTTAADAKEEEADTTTTAVSYKPCKKVYEWALDEKTPLLKPELIKDEECYYIVMKMDIMDRMTENDIWAEGTVENTRKEMYQEEFDTMLEDMGLALSVARNEKAFKRYKVLDVDVVGYQSAMMASYYATFGGGFDALDT